MGSSNNEVVHLVGQDGPLNGKKWVLQESLTIGRDDSCDIVIIDRQVSRYHARIYIDTKGIVLEDLQSKNGTLCNNKVVDEPVFLHDGDIIQIALLQQFVYLNSDSTLPIESVKPDSSQIGKTGLYLDKKSRRVWINQQEITPPLSVPQFRLLEILLDKKGNVVSRQDIINYIWEDESADGISDQALDALVRRLRDRLETFDTKKQYVTTVRGHGLRLED